MIIRMKEEKYGVVKSVEQLRLLPNKIIIRKYGRVSKVNLPSLDLPRFLVT